jgi:adenylate cyclase
VGRNPADSADRALRKQLAVLLFLGVVPLTIAWTLVYLAVGASIAAASPAIYSIVTPINTAAFGITRNLSLYRASQLLMTLLLPFGVTVSLGGFRPSSVVIIWAALCPVTALLIEEPRRTIVWIAGFALMLIVAAALDPHLDPAPLPDWFATWFFVLNIGMVITVVFALLYYFVVQRDFFYARSEALLLNILPKDISEALKTEHRTIAAYHESASVLFADVVGFTPLSSALAPMKLVELLNEVFQSFDALAETHGLEKIKTIGDCYMAAAGVPRARPDHAQALVRFALEIRDLVATQSFAGRRLEIRIGVNSGPVVAGVIGRKKFIYDLWGEAVNLASRMESHGESGKVQITRSTYDLVRDSFDCESRGVIKIKGADMAEVWHVIRPRAEAAA